MPSALRQFELANASPVFFGHGFDIAEVMDLARTEAPKPSKLAKYAAPTPAQQHTSNSGDSFALAAEWLTHLHGARTKEIAEELSEYKRLIKKYGKIEL
jgi:hypothetical protein